MYSADQLEPSESETKHAYATAGKNVLINKLNRSDLTSHLTRELLVEKYSFKDKKL